MLFDIRRAQCLSLLSFEDGFYAQLHHCSLGREYSGDVTDVPFAPVSGEVGFSRTAAVDKTLRRLNFKSFKDFRHIFCHSGLFIKSNKKLETRENFTPFTFSDHSARKLSSSTELLV